MLTQVKTDFFGPAGSLFCDIFHRLGGDSNVGTWERKGAGFQQSRGSFHPTPRTN